MGQEGRALDAPRDGRASTRRGREIFGRTATATRPRFRVSIRGNTIHRTRLYASRRDTFLSPLPSSLLFLFRSSYESNYLSSTQKSTELSASALHWDVWFPFERGFRLGAVFRAVQP